MIYLIFSMLGIYILIGLSSCSNDPNLKKVEQGQMSLVTYRDHTYIVWSINTGGGVVHNPDCECKKKEK